MALERDVIIDTAYNVVFFSRQCIAWSMVYWSAICVCSTICT